MAIIDKIQLSGTVYTIGNETTTAVTSASTDNEIPTAKAVYDAIPQGGGGKAIEAGRGISITTGETADTVSFNLPISAGTRTNALIYNSTTNSANGNCSNAEGEYTTASGYYSHAEGYIANANGYASHAEGESTKSKGYSSHAEGTQTEANGDYSHSEGHYTRTTNESEHSSGRYNNSVSASTTFGDSGNTLFSVGNGKSNSSRHNAIDIRQNGDIYIADTNDTSTTNYYEKPMIKLQDALGGSGGESCTVDSTAIFYTFKDRYSNDALDMMARYAVLDYGHNKTETPDTSIEVYFRDIDYIPYVNQTIQLNYSTSSYTLGDISQAEYIDVTYDSTIEDFKIAVATAYTSTVFIDYINFLNGNIKVPFYTISSGSPCTAIENDIPTAISELGNNMLKGLKEVFISSQQDAISIYTDTIGGNDNSKKIKLDEIDGSNSTLKPDIYVGLGTSGWTEINLSDLCNVFSLKSTKYRVTYNNNSELYAYFMGLQFIVEYAGNEMNNSVVFDETKHPSLQTTDLFSAATIDWNASTMELVITYPETIELNGKQESVNISQIYSNGCNFGNAITKLESYGEVKQALKPYVKETRAALSGKQDTLVSGTNIKTINNQSILGEGNIDIQGGGVDVVQTTGASTTDVMSQDAVTKALRNTNLVSTSYSSGHLDLECKDPFKTSYRTMLKFGMINGMTVANITTTRPSFSLVETSAITTSVTSSSTDSQVPSAKAVYDALQEGGGGGSITIDPSLDSGSTNAVANSAITNAINETARFYGYASDGYLVRLYSREDGNAIDISGMKIKTLGNNIAQTDSAFWLYTSTINGKKALSNSSSNTKDFSLVETSAITTSVTSSSTDSQVPSAKAVYDQFGGLKLVKLTQSEYDSLTTKDNSTLYVIVN